MDRRPRNHETDYKTFQSTLSDRALEALSSPERAKVSLHSAEEFDFFPAERLLRCISKFDENLGKHGYLSAAAALIILKGLNHFEGLNLSPAQKTGIICASALGRLGLITDKGDEQEKSFLEANYPAIGMYIFWNNFLPVTREEKEEKKMTAAGILYHKIESGRVGDFVYHRIRLKELLSNLPLITQAKYRQVATIVHLIEKTISILENPDTFPSNNEKMVINKRNALDEILSSRLVEIDRYFHYQRSGDYLELRDLELDLYNRVKELLVNKVDNILWLIGQ